VEPVNLVRIQRRDGVDRDRKLIRVESQSLADSVGRIQSDEADTCPISGTDNVINDFQHQFHTGLGSDQGASDSVGCVIVGNALAVSEPPKACV